MVRTEKEVPVKKIVIIGGGPAGRTVINNLHRFKRKIGNKYKLEVLLIDRKEYGDNVPACPRTLLEPWFFPYLAGLLKDVYCDYKSTHLSIHTMVGDVQRVSQTKVFIKQPVNGSYDSPEGDLQEILFDALIIAVGADYPIFKGSVLLIEQRRDELRKWREGIINANHILVVGGGVVGVEMAGEILTAYPGKQVTLVHSKAQLLDTESVYCRLDALKRLQMYRNVKVLLEQRVDLEEVKEHGALGVIHTYTTTKGENIDADLAIDASGLHSPNTRMFLPELGDIITDAGYVKVVPTLQVPNHPNMFTLGDCAGLQAAKLAANLHLQGRIAAKNVISYLRKGVCKKEYTSWFKTAPLIVIGPRYGIFSMVEVMGRSPRAAFFSKFKTKLYRDGRVEPVQW